MLDHGPWRRLLHKAPGTRGAREHEGTWKPAHYFGFFWVDALAGNGGRGSKDLKGPQTDVL